MKQHSIIYLLACLLCVTGCNKEEELNLSSPTSDKISFTGTLQQENTLTTRANDIPSNVLDDTHGTVTIHQLDATNGKDTAYYIVRNGYWGTLDSIEGSKPLDWKGKSTDVTFHAWTTPEGVSLSSGKVDNGTVDFEINNQALEHLIGARAVANYEKSHTVTLPFNHLVGKITIDLRDQYNKVIDNAQITFLDVNNISDFLSIDGEGPKVKNKTGELSLTYVKGKYMYLPPISFNSMGDGDFRIAVNSEDYFGTMNGLKIATEKNGIITYADLDSLKAGHHLKLKMVLTKGHGVGIGPEIVNWQYKDPDNIIGSNYKGIFSAEDLQILAESINTDGTIPDNYSVDGQTVKLYKNIDLSTIQTWQSIGTKGNPFTGTFDGQGYTISGIQGATGLFGTVGNGTSATIQNLRLSGSITGTGTAADGIALLIDTATNTTVTNCHVIGTSSVSNASATAGGLIGIAGASTTISQCSFTGTITGNTIGGIGGITGSFAGSEISNCFVSETGTAASPINIIGSRTAGTIKNSYSTIKVDSNNADKVIGYYWKEVTTTEKSAEFTSNGNFTASFETWATLLDALNANVGTSSGISWVYVYGKDFPVLRIQ